VTTIIPLGTYRNERPFPFCPGCGHSGILEALDAALVKRAVDPAGVVIVSDIGCSGLSDQYFSTSAFHGLHGRSLTYATGIKLADPSLEVIVVMGDGGTGIGGAHLLNAARRNVGLTVLVFNNLNFGMTGGQHSTTTPQGAYTSTTPEGNLERPLDIGATVAVNGAAYVWRGTSYDADLSERIADAMAVPGFSLLDIWEPCTAYFVRSNKVSRTGLMEIMESLGLASGVIARREVPEYCAEYRRVHADAEPGGAASPIEPAHRSDLDRRFVLVAAGAAGGKVRSAARLAGIGAVDSGLWVAKRDEYPITVKSGHSVSTLVLDSRPIDFAGSDRPDLLILLAPEGVATARPWLAAMQPGDRVIAVPQVLGTFETAAGVAVADPSALRVPTGDVSLMAIAAAVAHAGLFPLEALASAVDRAGGRHADRSRRAVEAGAEIAAAIR
jgi:pyruvate/2-oxoacid:ferredoxin oxidoreductase beta subunit/Pyruvate/2-oxoacid:ferredoxin oxidoreductase gamma subunit